jgi:hypothetical protein
VRSGRRATRSSLMGFRSIGWLALIGMAAVLSSCDGGGNRAQTSQKHTTTLKHVRITHPPARVSGRAAVLQQINVVCTAVGHGLPAPPRAPFTRAKLRRYAREATKPEQRLTVSLHRLQKIGDARRVRALSRAWNQARALLLAVGAPSRRGGATAVIGRRLQASAAVISSLADRDRLPACGGVAPR